MQQLRRGHFFGQHKKKLEFSGVTITDTEYTHDYVPWHYHENAYFTYILHGCITETSKQKTVHCPPGTLLFHYWEEPHSNTKLPGYAQGFHIEVEKSWFDRHDVNPQGLHGHYSLENSSITDRFSEFYKDTVLPGDPFSIVADGFLLQLFGQLTRLPNCRETRQPPWVNHVRNMLTECSDNMNLVDIAKAVNIHPAHLSREFPRYFHSTFAKTLRRLRVEKALSLLPDRDLPLSDIAYRCGFSDQSHLNRCFKEALRTSPLTYRRSFTAGC